jgi:hypothetical protein
VSPAVIAIGRAKKKIMELNLRALVFFLCVAFEESKK